MLVPSAQSSIPAVASTIHLTRPLWLLPLSCLALFISGCVSLPSFADLKELPGFEERLLKEHMVYDSAIRAYRIREKPPSKGAVLRNAAGEKISTEEELDRFTRSSARGIVGPGTRNTAYVLATLYAPFNAVDGIFYGVPMIPLFLTAPAFISAYKDAAGTAYLSGREHFNQSEFNEALANLNRAKAIWPELQALSDVDYWRGRALQEKGKIAEAFIAYRNFLTYSEGTRPDFFKKNGAEMTWEELAFDIEKRLVGSPNLHD